MKVDRLSVDSQTARGALWGKVVVGFPNVDY